MDFDAFSDWLYYADLVTGVWWYKAFLVSYYLAAILVVRIIWRRTLQVTAGRRRLWLLVAAALLTPSVVGVGAGILMPFLLGATLLVVLGTDYPSAAAFEFLIGIATLLVVWLALVTVSALSNKSLERGREG